jgi:hypothetical protein
MNVVKVLNMNVVKFEVQGTLVRERLVAITSLRMHSYCGS